MPDNKAKYPEIKLTAEALASLPEPLRAELAAAPALYQLDGPNGSGMVFVGTSPTGSGGIATFVRAADIEAVDRRAGKTVVLLYQDGSVQALLHAATPCDGLLEALDAAEHDWNATDEGLGTDWDAFVLKYLADCGYDVRLDDGFETYCTCL